MVALVAAHELELVLVAQFVWPKVRQSVLDSEIALESVLVLAALNWSVLV